MTHDYWSTANLIPVLMTLLIERNILFYLLKGYLRYKTIFCHKVAFDV